MFGIPRLLPADGETYDALVVQLQNAAGIPARARRDITLFLTSTKPELGSTAPEVVLPVGSTFALAAFDTTATNGSTTVSVAATGYSRAGLEVETVGFPLDLSLTSGSTALLVGGQVGLRVAVSSLGLPVPSAGLLWTTSFGRVDAPAVTDAAGVAEGTYSSNQAGTASIAVEAQKPGFSRTVGSLALVVSPTVPGTATSPFSQPLLLTALGGIAALAVGIGLVLYRRRRQSKPELFL
jgi:hypothetical protein